MVIVKSFSTKCTFVSFLQFSYRYSYTFNMNSAVSANFYRIKLYISTEFCRRSYSNRGLLAKFFLLLLCIDVNSSISIEFNCTIMHNCAKSNSIKQCHSLINVNLMLEQTKNNKKKTFWAHLFDIQFLLTYSMSVAHKSNKKTYIVDDSVSQMLMNTKIGCIQYQQREKLLF